MRRTKRDDEFEDEDEEIARPRRRRRPTARRFPRRRALLVALIVLATVVAFLPSIASLSICRPLLISLSGIRYDGRIEVGDLSLGWFSPIHARQIRIYDERGNLVVGAEEIRTEKTLTGFALGGDDFGLIEMQRPTIHIVVRNGGSNVEDLLASILADDSSSEAEIPKATVRWNDGEGQVTGEKNLPPAQFASTTGEAQVGGPDAPLTFATSAKVLGRAGASGLVQLKGSCGSAGVMDVGIGKLTAQGDLAPIDLVALVLARWGQSFECQGQMTGDASISWSGGGETMDLALGNVRINQFGLLAPSWLQTDRLFANELHASGLLRLDGWALSAQEFRCQTEFASIDATGAVDLQKIAATMAAGRLPETDFQIGGNVDLAKLSQMLPNAMRLRQGAQIQRANLEFQSFCRTEGARRRWLIDGEAQNFAGVHNGQAIRWTKPIRVSAAFAEAESQLTLESLQIDTNSISIRGQSSLQSGQLNAAGDLGQLQTELEQFFSLGDLRLDGRFDGELKWTGDQAAVATEAWPVQLEGKCTFDSLLIAIPGLDRIEEKSALVRCNASGQAARTGGVRIDTAGLDWIAEADQFKAELLQAVDNPRVDSTLPIRCTLTGDLASWLQRLGPLLPNFDARVGGAITLKADATLQGTTAQLKSAEYEITDLRFDGYGLQIQESRVAGSGNAALDWSLPRVQVADVTLTSSSLAGRGANLNFLIDANGFQLTGDVAYRADVNRVARWFGLGQDPTGVQWFGAAEGTAQLLPMRGAVAGSFQTRIIDLAAAKSKPTTTPQSPSSWDVLWQESLAQFEAKLSIASDWNAVRFEQFVVQSKAVELRGQGTIEDLGRSVQLDLTGQWIPNWAALSAIAQGYTGRQVDLRGTSRPELFRVHGPLWTADMTDNSFVSRQLVAETSAHWDSGQLFGLPIGPAAIQATLTDAVIEFNNPQIQVGPGLVHFNPLIDLRSDPQLIFARGTIVESVELTPELCRDWFRYIAPLLAEATRAQGKFSLIADGWQMPLANPLAGRGSGTLMIEQAVVEPGPLGRQLVQLARLVKQMTEGNPLETLLKSPELLGGSQEISATWLQLPPQEIAFKLEQQQFVHERMNLNIVGIPMSTRGAIGLDTSLNLVAEIPILDGWIERQPALASLKGTSIRIPVTGTLAQPRVDHRALAQLSIQMFQKTAGNQIESRLNSLLNDAWQKNVPPTQQSMSGVPAQPTSSATPAPIGESLQKTVEDNLLQGLDRLFAPKK